MNSPSLLSNHKQLAHAARLQFVDGLCASLPLLDKKLQEFLLDILGQHGTREQMQAHRETWMGYEGHRRDWLEGTIRAWREHHSVPSEVLPTGVRSVDTLELLNTEVLENRLLASRMAQAVLEQTGALFEEVRRRTECLQERNFDNQDILNVETLCLRLIEQWFEAGLRRNDLHCVLEPLQQELGELLSQHYQAVLKLYDDHGVPTSTVVPNLRRSSATPVPTKEVVRRPAQDAPRAVEGNNYSLGRWAGLRAQAVMAQLRRLLSGAGLSDEVLDAQPISSALTRALKADHQQVDAWYPSRAALISDEQSAEAVVQSAHVMRTRAQEFKKAANQTSEKAIIEVVALMFQSILSEERIPAVVRVWVARLQVPVLRVALADPSFFRSQTHPARQLIDRIGSCVLGFDASSISGSALEAEIRRIVQVIEQYPETGRQVFELMLGEFEKFLATFLTEKQGTSRIVSVAQQLEQKETLTIQYTIEMRSLLADMPVHDAIRNFLFKTWAEVLALCTVRCGARHADTMLYKRAASDLVWSAGAKHNRAERAKAVRALPALLQVLRQGMVLVGVSEATQNDIIRGLTGTLSEAFFSRTAVISQARIDALSKRLVNLEDLLDDGVSGDMSLNSDSIETLLGVDATSLHVLTDADVPEQKEELRGEMLMLAQELVPGTWFMLRHDGTKVLVQYAWRSQRGQLHLFVAADGRNYLIQLRHLACCLQTGCLTAQEHESLTLRATREAVTQLDTQPGRLLGD